MGGHFLLKAPVDMALGGGAVIEQDPSRILNGRRRISVVDVVLLEVPRSDISRLSGVYFLRPALLGAIQQESLTGLVERDFTISFDPQMSELGGFDGLRRPNLSCVEVRGDFPASDFSHVEGSAGLVVSSRTLAVLERFDLTGTIIAPFA